MLAAGHYAVVVADPCASCTGDSNADRAAVDLMRQFDRWRAQHEFALSAPMHCRSRRLGEWRDPCLIVELAERLDGAPG